MLNSEKFTENKSAFRRWLNVLSEPVTQDLRSAIWKKDPDDPERLLSRAEVREDFLEHVPLTGSSFSEHMINREHKELERFLVPWSERPAWSEWGPSKVRGYYGPWKGALSTLDDDMATFKRKYPVSVSPLPIRKVWNRLPSATSSGLPWLQSHWKEQIGAPLAAQIQDWWARDKPGHIPPSMPMWRVDPPGKTRLAWAESKYEALLGAPFVYPVADKLKNLAETPFVAWRGPDDTAADISHHMATGNCEEYLSVDYSAYDQTQSPELVRRVWRNLIHPMSGSSKPNVSEAWLKNFTSGDFLSPDAVYSGDHGVPSGSVATNFVDSVNNALCIEGYLANNAIDDAKYWVQGDDALICGHGVDPKDFAEFAQSEYGFEAHPDKQHFGNREGDFLQMSYYSENDYLPTYPVSRVGWRMIGHERFSYSSGDWNKWAVVVRAIQQLQNAYYNPSINPMVEWAADGDRLRLGAGEAPIDVMRMAGSAGTSMTQERKKWDLGAEDRKWDVLPVQRKIRELVDPPSFTREL